MESWINRLENLRSRLYNATGEKLPDIELITQLLSHSTKENETITQREIGTTDLSDLKIKLKEAEAYRPKQSKGRILKTESQGPMCFNCGQRGHIRFKCKAERSSKEMIEQRKKDFFGSRYKEPKNQDPPIQRWSKQVKMIRLVNGNECHGIIYYDTCASIHVTGNQDWLHNYSELEVMQKIEGIDTTNSMLIHGIGELHFSLNYNGCINNIVCEDIAYVPGMLDTISNI